MDNNTFRNETDRVVISDIFIHLGPDAYDNSRRIFAFREDGQAWQTVSPTFDQPYSLIGRICDDRALDVEAGILLCNDKRLIAEDYLALWREAASHPMTNAQLVARGGYLTVILKRKKRAFCAAFEKMNDPSVGAALLERPDCFTDGPTVLWTLRLIDADAVATYDKILDIWCNEPDEPGENSVETVVHLPDDTTSSLAPNPTSGQGAFFQCQYCLEM